jgi:acetyltransferase
MAEPLEREEDVHLSESQETIRGGEHVLIRRVRPEDMALHSDLLGDVSADDLWLRFFATARIAELGAAEIKKLSHLNYRHEMAFVALDGGTAQMLGIVCLIDELDEKTAEFAILVRSRLKGHGLGWRLMQRVIEMSI